MTVLEEIRANNPNLALVPDNEIIEQLLESYQGDLDPDEFLESLYADADAPVVSPVVSSTEAGRRPIGTATDPSEVGFGEAFTSGLKSNWQRTWGPGITYLRGGIAGLMGDEDRAAQLYQQAAQQDREILDKSGYISFEQAMSGPDAGLDTFVKAGLYATGMSLPYTLFGGVGALAGRALLGKTIGTKLASLSGFYGSSVPVQASFNLGRQQEQVQEGNLEEVNEATALGASLLQAGFETLTFPVMTRLFGPLNKTQAAQKLQSSILSRTAKGTTTAAFVEGVTEVGQQALERAQAGLQIDSPDAFAEYKEAFAGGAFVGGLLGGASTVAGEAARAVQPTPTTPVAKPVEAPKVEKGIIQDTTVTPEQIDTATEEQVKTEQAKPKNFVVEKQGEKFALKRQDLDTTGNVASIGTVGTFNTEAEATAEQQKQEDQKNKLTEQTYFTKEAIVKENPTVGNLINELEDVGNTIAPHVQQVYFQKNIALPKGNLSSVKASGGNEFSVVDGWYDRTSDLAAISLIDQSKALETTAHENFHALQRQIGRNYQSGLFLEEEQTALNTFLPGGKVSEIAPSVQNGLGKDVMQRLQERHGENSLSNREMQAYAFGAYTALKAKKKTLAAPNPVIRAFNRLSELIKRAGDVFRKNKINNVNDLFEKARTGEIGKRAKPKEGVEKLRKEALAREDKKELSLTTVKTDKGDVKSIIPNIDPNYGEEIIKTMYNRGITGNRLLKMQVARRRPEQKQEAEDSVLLANNEQQLISDKEYIIIKDDVTGATARIGDLSGRNVSREYGPAEITRLGKAYARAVEKAPGIDYSLSRVEFREQIKKGNDTFGKKYGLKTALSEGKKENLSKIGIALDKEHAETYGVINQTPRFVKGKIAEENQKEFNDAVEAGYQELKYQLELGGETSISGTGWYNKAITDTIERVKDILPQMREGSVAEQTDKELQFKLFLALFSPQGGPEQNLDVATQVFKEYLETGKAVTKKSLFVDSPKFGVSHQSMVSSLKLVDYLSKKHGKKPGDLKNYLFSTQTYKQLGKEKLDSGFFKPAKNQKKQELDYSELSDVNKTSFNEETGKIEESILMPAYMFGEKVGTFFLNFNGIEGVTKDRWFSRHFYRQFGQVGIARDPKTGKPLKSETKMVSSIGGDKVERTYPPGHDPVTKLRDVPKANDRKVMELYVEGIKQKAIDNKLIKNKKDATRQNVQAILWYFEQGLYTDLGLKSVPVDYVQAVEALENKIKNDIKTGGQSYGQFYDTKVIKSTATDVKTKTKTKETKETRAREEEKELSVSDNLTDVIPKEFSVSDKKLDGKVELKFYDEGPQYRERETFDDVVGGVRELEIDSAEKLKPMKDLGDGSGRVIIGINLDGEPVGSIVGGITENNTLFVANTEIFGQFLDPVPTATVSLWKQVARQIKEKYGVTKFSGQRITGARRKFGVVADKAFITRELSLTEKEMKDADDLQFSVSEDLLTDKEISESTGIPNRVKEKLFKNRELKDGERVSVRPNLNGRVEKNDNKLFVQTIHPGNNLNKALGYDGAVTVTNPSLFVNQRARANIASKKDNKFPMAAARGQYSSKKPKLDGVVLNFNPFNSHLFVDQSGFAVKSIKGDAVMFNTKVYTEGEIDYYSREDAPEPLDNIESQALYKFETEADKENVGKSELETLSQKELIENDLEFAVSDETFSEGTERVIQSVNPKRQRRTLLGYWKQHGDNIGVKIQQGLTDQYISVKKFIGEEPYKALTMTYGASGATESALLYGVPFLDKDGAIDLKADSLGTGLFTRLEKLGADLPNFLTWVASNRAKAIYDRGMEAGLSSREDVIQAIKELPKGKEKLFNESLKDLQEFNNAFLDIAVKSGYLDPESRKAWTDVDGFNFYIPFYRLLDDSASNSGPRAAADIVNQKEYPALRGSDLPVNDLLSNIVQNYAFLTEASLKNVAGLKTLEKGAEMGVTRQVKFPTKNSVFVRKNGKKVFYEVDEPLVLQSLTALNWNGWQNPAMGVLRTFKRFLTYGVTASPAFRIRNLLRDSIHSVAVGELKVNPLGNVLEGGKGLSKDKNKQASELRARLGFGGGSIHFGHIYGGDPNATQMLLNRAIDTKTVMETNGWSQASRKLLGKYLNGGLRWWEDVGSFSENINRAALYKQLRDKGVSHFEASYQARDLLNFSRHGANPMVRFLTQSVPFLNARLQGLDKLTRAMGPKQRAQLLSVLGTYSLASIGLYLAYKDDDDFKQREQWDRDTYHWFKIPGSEAAFRIPRPFEVGAVGVIFERMVEQMVDDDVHGSVLAERMLHVITETFAFDVRPQALTPLLEVYANKDSFTDRPIEGMAFKRLPPTERKYAYTSSAYVNTSKLLNLIPFKSVNLSPVQIEHLVQGYFGWVGSTAAAAISLSDYPRQYARFTSTGWDTPLGMGFFKSLPSVQSKYKTQFYDQLQQMNEVFSLQRLYESRGEWEKVLELKTEQKSLLAWRKQYNRVQRKIQQLNREIRRIESDKRLSNSEIIDKVRQINIVKNDTIRALVDQVLAYEKRTGERVRRERWFTL